MRWTSLSTMIAALLALLLVGCGSSPASGPAVSGSPTAAPASGPTATPTSSPEALLLGEWDTGPYPASRLRAAIMAEGYTRAEANEVVGKKKMYEVHLKFFAESERWWMAEAGWDPSKQPRPTDFDHGPYEILAGGELKTTCDVCDITTDYQLFSYALRGFTLKLHFLRNVNPEASAYDRKFGPAYGLSLTLKPFHKF